MKRLTLKEKFTTNKDVIFERVILREFNTNTMNQATIIFKSLLSINFAGAGLRYLASARDAVINDIDEILASKKGLIQKFISFFKKEDENPLLDSLAFCEALKNFFTGLLQYVDARKTGVENPGSKKLQELISTDDESTIAGLAARNQKLQTLEKLIVNALKPKSSIKNFAKNWQKKYIKNDLKNIAKELMNATVDNIEKVGNEVLSALKNVDAVSQSAVGATTTSTKQMTQTTGTEQTSTTQPTSNSEKTQKSGIGGSPPIDKKREQNAKKIANDVYDSISSEFDGVDPDDIKNVIAVLAYNDLIKT